MHITKKLKRCYKHLKLIHFYKKIECKYITRVLNLKIVILEGMKNLH